jgi:hypothetical protein
VCRFATSCLKQIIGPAILGDKILQVLLGRMSSTLKAELISDVRHFITAKQHENVSIHALLQGIAINDIAWLAVPNVSRPNPQEALKRRKLVEELVTWLFEGYLIPLLRVGPSCHWNLIGRILSTQRRQLLRDTKSFTIHTKHGPLRPVHILLISKIRSYKNSIVWVLNHHIE